MMISKLHTTDTPFVILALLVFLAGCGLFETGEDEYMDMTALAAGRMLFASPPAGEPDGNFSLYTLDAKSTSATISLFIATNYDFASPSIVNIPGAFWLVGFGIFWILLWIEATSGIPVSETVSGPPPLFGVIGIVMGAAVIAIWAVPLFVIIKFLRGAGIREAVTRSKSD